MMADKNSEVEKLNNLLDYLHDSCKGYKELAKDIEDKQLKYAFSELSDQREMMIHQLEKEISANQGKVKSDGTVAGALHRVMMDIKSKITNGDVKALKTELERGENVLIEEYNKAISDEDLPGDIKFILGSQLSSVKSNLQELIARMS